MIRRLATGLGRSSLLQLQAGGNAAKGWCFCKEPVVASMMAASNFNSCSSRAFSVSATRRDLMEFFDDKKNWGESSVRTGRSWKIEELRIKSNTDLHKLWYILLKERNMLSTMEHECKQEAEMMPNPERIDKVDESMKNLEEVVRERNRAYFLLETGETGERSGAEFENFLGLPEYQQYNEHVLPKELNKPYLKAKNSEPVIDPDEKKWFLSRLREQQRQKQRRALRHEQWELIKILERFPDTDVEVLREKYPDVNVDKYVQQYVKDRVPGNLRPKEYFAYGTGRK